MSILINNDLIWVSIPRCASVSIENKLMNLNIDVKYFGDYNKIIERYNNNNNLPTHFHYSVTDLYEYFGYKETICINRDWLERWMSSLRHLISTIKFEGFTPIIDYEDINNDFLYEFFDIKFINDLYSINDEKILNCYSKLIKDDFNIVKEKSTKYSSAMILLSQNFWKNNERCTYEFDFNEIYKFEKFMEERYNLEFKLPLLNNSSYIKNDIIIDDNLKKFIWNLFEKPFIKTKKMI